MKHVLVRERLIWEALHQDATSDFDVLWEILQSREVQGYVTDEDLTALYHRLAQEQGFGSAHQLTSQFRRVLTVYSPEQHGALDVAIAHPHDDNPLEPTEDLPTLSVASFLERYVLYQLYQTDTPEVPQGGWYRRWRASGFDPMLLWPVALVLVLQELPVFQQWLLASKMMPGGDKAADGLSFGQRWAIASYPRSDATMPTTHGDPGEASSREPARPNEPPASRSDLVPYPDAAVDPLLRDYADPLVQAPQFSWRDIVREHGRGDRPAELSVSTAVELPSPPIEHVTLPQSAPAPVVVLAQADAAPEVRPAAPVEPQRVEGPTRAQPAGGSLPVTGEGRGASSGQPAPPPPDASIMGGGSTAGHGLSGGEAPPESMPPGDEGVMILEVPSGEPTENSPSPHQETASAPTNGDAATDSLLGQDANATQASVQPSAAPDVLLNPEQPGTSASEPPVPAQNGLHLNPHHFAQFLAPKQWQQILDAEVHVQGERLPSPGEPPASAMVSTPAFMGSDTGLGVAVTVP